MPAAGDSAAAVAAPTLPSSATATAPLRAAVAAVAAMATALALSPPRPKDEEYSPRVVRATADPLKVIPEVSWMLTKA